MAKANGHPTNDRATAERAAEERGPSAHRSDEAGRSEQRPPASPPDALVDAERRRGRGARSNQVGRFECAARETFDDGWESLADLAPFKTEVYRETAKSIIASNDSPDISFEQSINPYRGCEHGCIYCFARPTHC
ncbi:MAG TPA: radical SAM protein, partial [Hyphomicrobiaceae bacterium]|nr:radical SAM protein [Hyphomicrobiaceae bacterium]